MAKSKRPKNVKGDLLPFTEPTDSNKLRPKFCFQHLLPAHDVNSLKDKDLKAALVDQMQRLSQMSWNDIERAPRHGLGQELIPINRLKINLPETFTDTQKVHVLRYSGRLPMVGVRVKEVLHLVAIARTFDDIYDHS